MVDMTGIVESQIMAEEHWDWLEPIVSKIPYHVRDDAFLGYLFKTAFIHGAKHEREKQ